MSFLLRVYRITAIALWLIFIIIVSSPYQLIGGWNSKRKISCLSRLWARGIAKIINLRVTLSGKIPSVSAGLVVSNHISYLDILAHGSIFPLRYTPKSDIASWPFIGWYLGLNQPIWIDRQSKQASQKATRDSAKTMRNRIFLIVYPEGTTTNGRSEILPFKSTSFEAAIRGNMPILPIITYYKEAPGSATVAWFGDMELLPHIWQVLKRPSTDVTLHFLEPILPMGRARKELADFTHNVMNRTYKELRAQESF